MSSEKSIIVEVDEITKGVLSTVQERIAEGSKTAIRQAAEDIFTAVDDSAKRNHSQAETHIKHIQRLLEEQMECLTKAEGRISQQLIDTHEGLDTKLSSGRHELIETMNALKSDLEVMAENVAKQSELAKLESSRIEKNVMERLTRLNVQMQGLEEKIAILGLPFYKRWFLSFSQKEPAVSTTISEEEGKCQ